MVCTTSLLPRKIDIGTSTLADQGDLDTLWIGGYETTEYTTHIYNRVYNIHIQPRVGETQVPGHC